MADAPDPAALKAGLPWTRSCYVCGESNPRGFHVRARREGDVVVIDYTTRVGDAGYADLVHGGICMTLLDEAMTWASILATRRMCVAAEITTRMKLPVSVGAVLRVEGRVDKNARRILLTSGRILDAGGQVLVEASGKFVPATEAQTRQSAADFVYDENTLRPEDLL